jgi:hypothetical protein
VFFLHRFCPSVAALLCGSRIVAAAVLADAEVGTASRASLAATREAGERPFPAAFPAMARHGPTTYCLPLAIGYTGMAAGQQFSL